MSQHGYREFSKVSSFTLGPKGKCPKAMKRAGNRLPRPQNMWPSSTAFKKAEVGFKFFSIGPLTEPLSSPLLSRNFEDHNPAPAFPGSCLHPPSRQGCPPHRPPATGQLFLAPESLSYGSPPLPPSGYLEPRKEMEKKKILFNMCISAIPFGVIIPNRPQLQKTN